MKNFFRTISVTLCICLCVPLFAACGGNKGLTGYNLVTDDYAGGQKPDYYMESPEYTLPARGTVLETLVPGTTVAGNGDWSDYARYADEYSLEQHSDGNWYHRDGTRVYPKANSSLKGKTIYWLGSSETLGVWTQTSTADALAALTGCNVVKNAFGGSTMLQDRAFNVGFGQTPDNSDAGSKNGRHLGEFNFSDRLNPEIPGNTAYYNYNDETWSYKMFDKTASVDAFVVAVSTNDSARYYCGNGTDSRWGKIKPYVYDIDSFDLKTTIGTMEYIVAYVWENWHCPIYFYTTPYFGDATQSDVDPSTGGVYKPHAFDANPSKICWDPLGSTFATEITWAKMIAEKWTGHGVPVGVIDMFNDADFNAVGDTLYEVKDRSTGATSWKTYYEWAMYDHVHAKNAGYIQWWAPYVEWYLNNNLFGEQGPTETDTSYKWDSPQYLLPSTGTTLKRVVDGMTYSSTNAACDYARYGSEFTITTSNGEMTIPERRANSSLKGKMIYWLGSSETFGPWSAQGAPDYLCALTGCKMKKNAFSETTMLRDKSRPHTPLQSPDLSNQGAISGRTLGEFTFVDRLDPDYGGSQNTAYQNYNTYGAPSYTRFDKTEHVDAFICAISVNDASSLYCGNGTTNYHGVIDQGQFDKSKFNVGTSIGAMEYIVAYVWETWHCPVFFYSGPYFGTGSANYNSTKPNEWEANPDKAVDDPSGSVYAQLVAYAKRIAAKWRGHGVPVNVIDMYNDEDFTAKGDTVYTANKYTGGTEQITYYQWAMYDFVHAKNAAYKQWLAPYFEWYLHNNLFGKNI